MEYIAKLATTNSADIEGLLRVFGIVSSAGTVKSLAFNATATNLITVTIERYVTEGELRALVEEFEATPPVKKDFIGLTHSRT